VRRHSRRILTFATGSRETERNPRTCRRMFSSVCTGLWEVTVRPWRIRNLDDQCDANLLIDHYRRTKRDRVNGFAGPTRCRSWKTRNRPAGVPIEQALLGDIERAGAVGADAAFTGIA